MGSSPGAGVVGRSFLNAVSALAFPHIAGHAQSAGGHLASEGPALKSGCRKNLFCIRRAQQRATRSHTTHQQPQQRHSMASSPGVGERTGGLSLLAETCCLHGSFLMMSILSEQPELVGHSQPRAWCPGQGSIEPTGAPTLQPAHFTVSHEALNYLQL